jgi:hypothetical protein
MMPRAPLNMLSVLSVAVLSLLLSRRVATISVVPSIAAHGGHDVPAR